VDGLVEDEEDGDGADGVFRYFPHRGSVGGIVMHPDAQRKEAQMEIPSTSAMELPSNWRQCVESIIHNDPNALSAMVFVPMLIKGYWRCFAINIKCQRVYVEMPVCKAGNYIVHDNTMKQLSLILLKELFDIRNEDGVKLTTNLEDWQFNFHRIESLENLRYVAYLFVLNDVHQKRSKHICSVLYRSD